ncbi:VOC family protein [bacterium]|nr:MAG: VOC family protein [bacterium]
MQKITPFLWFIDNAEEAMKFYTSAFKNSRIRGISSYEDAGPGQKGTVMTGTFELAGQNFMALNGGPHFKFSPAISFFVSCQTEQEVDELWKKLSEGGMVFMELDRYPFSEKFGWVADKFGLSWQVSLEGSEQKIFPFLMFVGKQHGKAEEAIKLYISIFKDSQVIKMERWGKGDQEPEGTVKHATFSLEGKEFMAMESGLDHPFTFSPATSFFVSCETQEEVDYFWESLSAGGEKQQCGWLQDKYGVSWQIVPKVLEEMLQDKDTEKSKRVMKAMLQMKKLDIKQLEEAFHG